MTTRNDRPQGPLQAVPLLPEADDLFGSAGEGHAEAAGEVLEALEVLDEVGFLWCFHAPLTPFEGRRRDRDSENFRGRGAGVWAGSGSRSHLFLWISGSGGVWGTKDEVRNGRPMEVLRQTLIPFVWRGVSSSAP
jgi:hypothetical protein